jgi:hypothetical protein
MKMRTPILAILAILTVAPLCTAKAELFNVCEILPTPDGFVALRDKPHVKGRLLARMRPGDMAVIDVKDGNYVQVGQGLLIEYHRHDPKIKVAEESYSLVSKGWAYTKFIDERG